MSKNVPKLRFKKRDGSDYPEWESKKVSEIFTFYSTNSLSRDKLADKKTEMKNIHYGDIHTKFGSILDVDKMELPYIKEESLSSIKNYTEAIDGDVFIADASEDYADIGKATEINNVNDAKIVGGLHVLHLRDEKEIYVNGIKGFLFNSPHIRNQIKIVAVGSKVLGLSKPGLGGLEISIMPKEEQSKIAGFFSAIDSRITNQSSKLDSLQELKKGVMQKIFSQEIRFKREDGGEYPEWEERRIDEVFDITRGVVIAKTSIDERPTEDCPYPVYSSQTSNSGILGYTDTYRFEGEYLTWTTDGANAGRVFKRDGKFNCTNVCGVLVEKKEFKGFANNYVAEALNKVTPKHVSYVGNPKLMNNVMAEIRLDFPCIEEQQKIADFLSTLDSKISLESQILETLQTLKKGLLQQMFV